MKNREMSFQEALEHVVEYMDKDITEERLSLMTPEEKFSTDKFVHSVAFMVQFFKTLEKQKKINLKKIKIKF